MNRPSEAPTVREDSLAEQLDEQLAEQLDDYWQALVEGSQIPVAAGTASRHAQGTSDAGRNGENGNPPRRTDNPVRQEANPCRSDNPVRLEANPRGGDNFQLLRRLFEARELLDEDCADPPEVYMKFPEVEAAEVGPIQTWSPKTLGDYELLEPLGRGGMGVVRKARQKSLGRLVAVKQMRIGAFATADEVRRFRAEAEAAAHLSHPNIVAIHEVGAQEGQPYFSMEYVAGSTLAALVAKQPLAPRTAAEYARKIALAVEYAHQRGVLHRDLKPANILIDAAGEPRITDFGLAKRITGDNEAGESPDLAAHTHTGDILGTPGYMSPEQASGGKLPLTPASDVYSLGAVLYELITGQAPFRADTSLATLRLMLETEPAPPRLLNPRVPRDLETICLKCLSKEPGQRYGTAQALANDLDRFLAGQPVAARPVGSLARFWRWCRRNPVVSSLVATAAVLLLAVAVVASAAAVRESALRKVADTQKGVATNERTKAVEAQQEEARARGLAEEHRNLAQLELADNLLRRGIAWCEQGEAPRGLLALARCLELLPAQRDKSPRADQIERVARLNLAVWSKRIHALRQVRTHPGGISQLATGADGKTIITGGPDGHALVWNAESGEPVGKPLAHGAPLAAVAISPQGEIAATAAGDSHVRLWNVATGKLLRKPRLEQDFLKDARHFTHPPRLIFNASGTRLAASYGRDVLINVATGEALSAAFPANSFCQGVAWNKAGNLLAAGFMSYVTGLERRMLLIHAESGELARELEVPQGGLECLAFSPDDKLLAVGTQQGLQFFDLATGKSLEPPKLLERPKQKIELPWGHVGEPLRAAPEGRRVFRAFNHPPHIPRHVDFHSAEDHLLVASGDSAFLWNARQNLPVGKPMQHQTEIIAATMSPRDDRFVTVGADHFAKIWNPGTQHLVGQPLHHTHPLVGATFLTGGLGLATATQEGTLRIFDVTRRAGQDATAFLHGSKMKSAVICPRGAVVVTAGLDGAVRFWQAATGRPLGQLELPKQTEVPNQDFLFSADGKLFYALQNRRRVGIWDAATLKPLDVKVECPSDVLGFAVGRAGGVLATSIAAQPGTDEHAAVKHQVLLWNTADGTQIGEPIPARASMLAFSPDEKLLATAVVRETVGGTIRVNNQGTGHEVRLDATTFHKFGEVRLWSTANGEPYGEPLPIEAGVLQLSFSPVGRLLAVAGVDQTVRLWDVAAEKLRGEPLRHQGAVSAMAFSRDGRHLATGSSDGLARIWNLAEQTGQTPTGQMLPHLGQVLSLSFSGDGKTLAVGCADYTHRLWDVATGEAIGPAQIGGPQTALLPNGKGLFVRGVGDGAGILKVAQPLSGAPGRVSAWLQTATNLELDDGGRPHPLDPAKWQAIRAKLYKLGGPP